MSMSLILTGAAFYFFGYVFREASSCFSIDSICPNGNITFWLRTRETPPEAFELDEGNLNSAPFIEGAPLIILIHGWTGHKDYSPNPELISAYLEHGDYNIISIDWGPLAPVDCYITAAYNVHPVGKCSAIFLKQLYLTMGKHWLNATHVVGFSLGAHVSGVIGYYLPGIPRITGLDPALPLFSSTTARPESRLDNTDAKFVDAYHSNGGWKGRLGTIGHVDFYLNSGATQPGCHFNSTCDHHRAVVMFSESINSNVGFYGRPCAPGILYYLTGISTEICPYTTNEQILVRAGEYVDQRTRGTYKIETNYVYPLAKGTINSIFKNEEFYNF